MNLPKYSISFCCALCLLMSLFFVAPALAAEQTGLYIAPKFVYGLTQIRDHKETVEFSGYGKESIKIGNETDSSFGATFAVGYDFMKGFKVPMRAELEYGILSEVESKGKFSDDDGKINAKQKFNFHTLMLNAYYDIYTGTEWTPFVGAGVGLAFVNSKGKTSYADYTGSGEDFALSLSRKCNTNFAWQIGAGVNYAFTENVSIEAGYRFMGLGSAKTKTYTMTDGTDTLTLNSKVDNIFMHQFSIGMRYAF